MIGWECMFVHETYKVILSVYVDDFKMAGTAAGVKRAWKAITGPDKLTLDEPTPFGPYLGCEQSRGSITRSEAAERLQNIFPLVDNGGVKPKDRQPDELILLIRWHMRGFHEQCIERYKELRLKNKSPVSRLKEYAFPSIDDHQIPPEEFENEGVLAKDASKVVMNAYTEQDSSASICCGPLGTWRGKSPNGRKPATDVWTGLWATCKAQLTMV